MPTVVFCAVIILLLSHVIEADYKETDMAQVYHCLLPAFHVHEWTDHGCCYTNGVYEVTSGTFLRFDFSERTVL
jgi:hypothetical protein